MRSRSRVQAPIGVLFCVFFKHRSLYMALRGRVTVRPRFQLMVLNYGQAIELVQLPGTNLLDFLSNIHHALGTLHSDRTEVYYSVLVVL